MPSLVIVLAMKRHTERPKCKPDIRHRFCEQKKKPCVYPLMFLLLYKTTRLEVGDRRGRKECKIRMSKKRVAPEKRE